MARVLVIHTDPEARRFLERIAAKHHQVGGIGDLEKGVHAINRLRPDVVLAGMDGQKKEALHLLKFLRRNKLDAPTVVVASPNAGALQPAAMQLGAAAFVEYPPEQSILDRAISVALQDHRDATGVMLPVSEEEADCNLSELEQTLNRHMQCPAGKNQVYLQSLIGRAGAATKPRIALKCPWRRRMRQPPDVYFEFIRDVCCGGPDACPAYQKMHNGQSG